tara:strand:- start:8 stop:250 length:243 start_codon:yes stop_codon:yes gene_type:complete
MLLASIIFYLSLPNQNVRSKSLTTIPWRFISLVIFCGGFALASTIYSAMFVLLTFIIFTMLLLAIMPFIGHFLLGKKEQS